MTAPVRPLALAEKAVVEVLEREYPACVGKIGGSPKVPTSGDFYVWVSLVGGATTSRGGSWEVDVDVLASTYLDAMNRSLDIEAILLGAPHRSSAMILDECYQNQAPASRPFFEDESGERVGALYVFTARRRTL